MRASSCVLLYWGTAEEILDSEAFGTQYMLQRGVSGLFFRFKIYFKKMESLVFISSFYSLSSTLGLESMVWPGTLSELVPGLYMYARSPVMSIYPKLLKVRSCTYVMETFAFGSVEYRRMFSVCLRNLGVYILFL